LAQVPEPSRLDRGALERIIRRAAELQAAERDIGEGLTEADLLKLGREVGIPAAFLQQALVEERGGALVPPERGLINWLAGPRFLTADRVIPEPVEAIHGSLTHWMAEKELLTVKRRFQGYTSWEPRADFFSTIKRDLQIGGRPYALAKAREVSVQVAPLDERRSHVRLVADLANTRRGHLTTGVTLLGSGAAATAVGIVLGVALPVAVAPTILGALVGLVAVRNRRTRLERVQVGMEQVLDRLEHREIQVPAAAPGGALGRIADEIRRNLGI
jgi:hypothetical protein